MTNLKVYVAGSSADIARVELWSAALVGAGITVTSTWPANVRAVGHANPRDADRVMRLHWASTCLIQVAASDVVWLLVPPPGAETRGAWFEIGFARACSPVASRRPLIICSGDTLQSIFCAIGDEYASDAEAIAAICKRAGTDEAATAELERLRSLITGGEA